MKKQLKYGFHAAIALVLGSGVFTVTASAENRVQVVPSYHNDVSRPLWQMAAEDVPFAQPEIELAMFGPLATHWRGNGRGLRAHAEDPQKDDG